MKKLLTPAIIISVFLLGVLIGVTRYPTIVSMLDGVSEIDIGDGVEVARTPEGFSLSPKDADFIYSSLLRNAWHWGADDTIALYADDESYYVIGSHAKGFWDLCEYSCYAKQIGVRINGRDGTVYDRGLEQWRKRGYLHIGKADLVRTITLGMNESVVQEKIGEGFSASQGIGIPVTPGDRVLVDAIGKNDYHVQGVHYWCRDGEAVILYLNGKVREIVTEMNFCRI